VGPLFLVVTFAALPESAEPLFGPFATLEAACGNASQVKNSTPNAAFCDRERAWHAALHGSDGWFIARLPLQDGVTPARIESAPPLHRIYFHQHAFSAGGVDVDGDWMLPCANQKCASEPIPIDVRDGSRDLDVEVKAEALIRVERPDTWELTVIFTKLRILGTSRRAAEWRALVERLRGHHRLR
jgi:hypothetical protein